MPSLANIPGPKVVKVFGRFGFIEVRVTGSHHILKKDGYPIHLSVPVHANKPVRIGTLRTLIQDANITEKMFLDVL